MDIQGSTASSNYTAISILFVLSYIFLFRHSLLAPGATQLPASTTLLRRVLTLLVVAHTLYTLRFLLCTSLYVFTRTRLTLHNALLTIPSTLLFTLLSLALLHPCYPAPPVNLFVLLDLPLTAPVSAIRVALLEKQRPAFAVGFQNRIPEDVETLLSRLSSFDARVIYIKYGPYPLSHCAPCVHHTDFAIFALAPTVLPYLRTLILTSFITSRPAQRPAWRTPVLVVLAAAFFAEVWWTVDGMVEFRDGKVGGWTHTQTYTARTALLLLLPLLIHHLPAHSSLSPIPPFISLPPPNPLRSAFPHMASDFHLANTPGAPPQTPQRPNPAFAPGAPSQGSPASSSSSSYPIPGPSKTFPNTTPTHTSAGTIPPLNSIPTGISNNGNGNVPQPPPPPMAPSTPFSTLNNTLSSLSTTLGALRVLEWARLAGMRSGDVRGKMDEYYATADRNAMYVRGDAALRREAERLGMGYGGEGRWPRFGGAGAENMKGNAGAWRDGDPRGLDERVGAFEDEDEGADGELRQEPRWRQQQGGEEERNKREKEEEEEELARSPLRAKARKAAQEISQVYLLRMGRGAGGGETASASASKT